MGATRVSTFDSYTVHVNNQRKPFNDRRVRRAIFLAVSRQNLFKAFEDQSPLMVARWMFPRAPVSPAPNEILQLPGYRPEKTADIAEGKKLLADAGYPSGFGPVELVSAAVPWATEVLAPAFAEELRTNLGITSKIRQVERALVPEEYKRGSIDMLVETTFNSTVADPAPMWGSFLKCGGSQNWSRYCNPEFDKLVGQIDIEMDEGKRRQLFNQGMDLLDQDAPFYLIGFNESLPVWRNYVKGLAVDKRLHNFSVGYDTAWLDK